MLEHPVVLIWKIEESAWNLLQEADVIHRQAIDERAAVVLFAMNDKCRSRPVLGEPCWIMLHPLVSVFPLFGEEVLTQGPRNVRS